MEYIRFTSKVLGLDFYVSGKGGTHQGLPVYTPEEISLIRDHAGVLTKQDHQKLYDMKQQTGSTIIGLLHDRVEKRGAKPNAKLEKAVNPKSKPLPFNAESHLKNIREILKS